MTHGGNMDLGEEPMNGRKIKTRKNATTTKPIKIIVEKHSDGYVAYPLGLKGVTMLIGLDKHSRTPVKLRTVLKRAWKDYEEHGGIPHEEFWKDLANEVGGLDR